MPTLQKQLKLINEETNAKKQEERIVAFLSDFLKLERYCIVCPWTENPEEYRPFVGLFMGKTPCYYIFTDSAMAHSFAVQNRLANEDGNSLVMKQPPASLLPMLQRMKAGGVQLLMIDEGASFLCHTIDYFIKHLSVLQC